MLIISLRELLLINLDNPAIASNKSDLNENLGLIASSQNLANNLNNQEESRLEQSLIIINQMDDSQQKVILLNDLALNYARLGNLEQAQNILQQSLAIANNFEDLNLKITTKINIAKYYAQIGEKSSAIDILENATQLANQVGDKNLQGELLLSVSLQYGEIGEEELAQTLFSQSQTIIAEALQPLPEFPFQETPSTFKLGFSGSINSYRDTTAFFGINFDFAKQWSEDDIFVDGNIYFDFDSSRTVNNYRPGSLILAVYRHHFNTKWNFFTDFFNSTNQNLYSSKNDDEDLAIITGLYAGAGLNLWRGESLSNFLDFQIGIGSRYEYDYIDFEERSNKISPALVIVLLGRGISLGKLQLNQTFAIAPALDDLNNYIISSDTKLSLPLGKRWFFNNRLFARYRNELVFESNPKVQFFFSTGLEYQF